MGTWFLDVSNNDMDKNEASSSPIKDEMMNDNLARRAELGVEEIDVNDICLNT